MNEKKNARRFAAGQPSAGWSQKMAELERDFISGATLLSECESPMEKMLLMAMYSTHHAEPYASPEAPMDGLHPLIQAELDRLPGKKMTAYDGSEYVNRPFGCRYSGCSILLVNHPVDKYRPDFLIVGQCEGIVVRVVVEVDGHDFHERTKEQAARDKKRDRWFQTHGYSVLRFTGSEVYADPEDCALQVAGHVDDLRRAEWEKKRKAS